MSGGTALLKSIDLSIANAVANARENGDCRENPPYCGRAFLFNEKSKATQAKNYCRITVAELN